jgi:hypothetical protein
VGRKVQHGDGRAGLRRRYRRRERERDDQAEKAESMHD